MSRKKTISFVVILTVRDTSYLRTHSEKCNYIITVLQNNNSSDLNVKNSQSYFFVKQNETTRVEYFFSSVIGPNKV